MPTTDEVIEQFNDAFQTRSPDLLADIVAADCVMEGIGPTANALRATTRA